MTGDSDLLASCERLWRNIVDRKLYITGGIGAHNGGLFLRLRPAERHRLFGKLRRHRARVLRPPHAGNPAETEYADVMESTLYNTIARGMALDGKKLLLREPARRCPRHAIAMNTKAHVAGAPEVVRCACCPPNIARIVEDGSTPTRSETTYPPCMHLYMGGGVHARLPGVDAP